MKIQLAFAWMVAASLAVSGGRLLAQAPAAPGGDAPAVGQAAGGQAPAAAAPAPAAAAASKPILPEVISTYGDAIDSLFFLISGITFVILVIVFGLFGYFVVKYRHQAGRRAVYTHGNNKLEICWTVATSLILVYILFVQKETWDNIKIKDLRTLEDRNPYLVRIFGEQFAWHFVYPGKDGAFQPNETKRIFAGVNPVGLVDAEKDVYSVSMMVPAGVPVIAEITSLPKYDPETGKEKHGVLHSFFQPNLRFKQDLVPYHPAKIWFEVKPGKTGKYEIACAELCGLGHYQMRADFYVLPDNELGERLGYDWKAVKARFPEPAK